MILIPILASFILASTPYVEQPTTKPLPNGQIPQAEVPAEDEVADRSSKNSQEYNLYDRDQNRNSRDDRDQYYYYQYDKNNRNSQKLYQRDDG